MENLYTPDCIRTFTGIYINPFKPLPDQIIIDDIAHSLSLQCRFAGHLPHHYSVAQHSVECSYLVPDRDKLQALMHDSPEAYLLDIPSPIKKQLPSYKSAENNLLNIIADKFRFNYPLSPETLKADQIMLHWEWNHLMLQSTNGINFFPSNNYCELWSPEKAEYEFITRYQILTIKSTIKNFNHDTII